MTKRSDGPLLTPEEMGYLQSLFQGDESGPGPTVKGRARLHLDPAAAPELALYLMGLGPLQLTAERGSLHLSFPAQVVEDPATASLAVELSWPGIVERHPARDRSLRVRPLPADGVSVADPSGRLTAPTVEDLSVSGISMVDSPSSPITVGTRLPGLLLRIPGQVLTVDGVVVRDEASASAGGAAPAHRLLALALDGADEARLALQAYVFRRFREEEQPAEVDPFGGG